MTTRDALLAAIRADPADDTVRLVFADWLEENGEPDRAEFIRLQCDVARLPGDGSEADALLRYVSEGERKLLVWDRLDPVVAARDRAERRAEELLRANKAHWFGWANPPAYTAVRFARGFPDGVMVFGHEYFRAAQESILRAVPLTGLEIWFRFPEEASELVCPGGLRNLTHLRLIWNTDLGVTEALQLIGESDQVGSVTSLELIFTQVDTEALVAALAAGRGWGRIRHLLVSFRTGGHPGLGLSADQISALGAVPHLRGLTELSASLVPGAGPVEALVRAFPGLESLDLGRLSPDGARALVRAGLPELRVLQAAVGFSFSDSGNRERSGVDRRARMVLGGTPLESDPAATGALITTPQFPKLLVLNLTGGEELVPGVLNGLGAHLVGPCRGPSLRFLGLTDAALGPDDAAALARCPAVRELFSLRLGWNRIADAGVAALGAEHWPRLAQLNLASCEIGEAGVLALVETEGMPELQYLWLSENPLGPAGCAPLTRARFPHLRALGLHACGATEDQKRALRERLGDEFRD
jgi:uncharacterized protein (TIGR02996 family)